MLNQEDILKCGEGDIIKYKSEIEGFNYLVVEKVDSKEGKVSGQIASPIGVNGFSIDDLVEKGVEIHKWKQD